MQETICLGCSCLCDDLKIDTDAKGKFSVTSNCKVAKDWLSNVSQTSEWQTQIDGNLVNNDLAIDRIVDLLPQSASPIITGLKGCSSQTIRAAIQLAEKLGGHIDPLTTKSDSHRLKALQQHGGSTCSLGEVIQRADLIIFWGDSIIESNPCLLNRLKLNQLTPFLPNGRKDRHLISISRNSKKRNDWCDESVDISGQQSTEVLSEITSELQLATSLKTSESSYLEIAQRIRDAQYPVIVFDSELAIGEEETAWNSLAKFVSVANEVNRIHTLSIRSNHASHMAESVLSWQTGYPRCINFSTGVPACNLDLCSTEQLIKNNQIDLCLFIGESSDGFFKKHLEPSNKDLQTILIGPDIGDAAAHQWDISISTSRDGIQNSGTFLRFDHVPLPSRSFSESNLPSIETILSEITTRIK